MNSFERYNVDENEIAEVNSLPKNPTKQIYIDMSDDEATYLNNNGKLELYDYMPSEPELVLLLFLNKYRKNPELLKDILDNFNDMSEEEKKIQLKRMQIMVRPMNTLEDFKESLRLANKELPWHKDKSAYGDRLMFANKKEDLGKIINVFGEESVSAKKLLEEFNDSRWGRGILYDEKNNIYELWHIPERSHEWESYRKFYNKKHLFDYLLNFEIQAVK